MITEAPHFELPKMTGTHPDWEVEPAVKNGSNLWKQEIQGPTGTVVYEVTKPLAPFINKPAVPAIDQEMSRALTMSYESGK